MLLIFNMGADTDDGSLERQINELYGRFGDYMGTIAYLSKDHLAMKTSDVLRHAVDHCWPSDDDRPFSSDRTYLPSTSERVIRYALLFDEPVDDGWPAIHFVNPLTRAEMKMYVPGRIDLAAGSQSEVLAQATREFIVTSLKIALPACDG